MEADKKIRNMRKNEDILKKMQEVTKLPKFSGGKLEDFVAYTLRKSLVVSKNSTQEFDSVAAMVVFLECIGKSNISDHEKEIVYKLLELIRKDFSKLDPNVKDSQGANIVRSVRNQNMIVQPQGDRFLFPQVSDKEKKTVTNKNVEKEGLNEFLLNYANLDDEKRAEILRKLRRILDVYFSAPNHYEKDMEITLSDNIDKEKFNVWKKYECGKKVTGLFVNIPDVLMEAEAENIKLDAVVEKRERKILADRVRRQNIICYRYTRAVVEKYNSNESLFFENDAINQYWIHHIENAVERILKNCKAGKLFKLRKGYLAEKVWKDAINLISIKYIALGKAVYNFALDDIWKDKKDKELGIVDERIRNGITSFDYEMIKAYENLQRELAVDIAFSVNNLARAVCDMSNLKDRESDFLLWKKEDIADYAIMLEVYKKYGYCKFLAQKLGFYNYDIGKYTYRMINEEYGLENYLEKMVADEVVLLQQKDRSELISMINAKQDGKLLKKVATLNQVLEERELDYRIKEFETTRYIEDSDGNKKKKKYKNAWKIVRF